MLLAQENESEKKITNLLTSWKHAIESNLFVICRNDDGRIICVFCFCSWLMVVSCGCRDRDNRFVDDE